MMNISVVIPYHRGHKYLRELFFKLFVELRDEQDEIIVVNDNSLKINDLDFIRKQPLIFKGLRVINVDINRSGNRAYARNLGAINAKNKILVFLDEDIVIGDGYMSSARNLAERCEKNIYHGIVYDYESNVYADKLNSYYPFYEDTSAWFDRCPSNNLVMLKRDFNAIGGFDDNFKGWGWEDIEFAYRAHLSGIKYVYPQSLTCYHVHHPVNRQSNYIESEKNYRYMVQKFPELSAIRYPYSKVSIYNRR